VASLQIARESQQRHGFDNRGKADRPKHVQDWWKAFLAHFFVFRGRMVTSAIGKQQENPRPKTSLSAGLCCSRPRLRVSTGEWSQSFRRFRKISLPGPALVILCKGLEPIRNRFVRHVFSDVEQSPRRAQIFLAHHPGVPTSSIMN
jgi:hypothetical protein